MNKVRLPWTASTMCIGSLLFVGCAATVEPAHTEVVYGYPVVYAETVPVEIETYPYVIYRGAPAYYVEGHWYYRGPRGWVVFRREPVELSRQRTIVERRRGRGPRRD